MGREEIAMLDHYYVHPKTADRIRALWLGSGIDRFAAWMADRGAAKATVTRCVQALIQFDQFAREHGATTSADLPALVQPFVDHWMREHGGWCTDLRTRQKLRSHPRTPVEQLLRILIPGFVGTTTRRPVPFQATAPGFFEYLQQERGLRPATLYQYSYHLRVFETYLQRLGIRALKGLAPSLLTTFLMEPGLQGKPLGPDGMQGRCGTLRVFLRYLYRQSVVPTDLSRAVPRRRTYRQATLPRAITWADVQRVLAVPDRRAPVGKRDYAILLLLATYGLRAREVAALLLDDIDWRRAQLHVSARKNGHSSTYPLSATVGDAIVDYLKSGRPSVTDRHLFLRVIAPFTPFPSSAIATRASQYLHTAGVEAPRAGSHTFRHTCVQRLVEGDVPFKVIGDYVGHRSSDSTQVYGKVAIHLLRQLALGDGEEVL
jgi:integrase/recombinase XerD